MSIQYSHPKNESMKPLKTGCKQRKIQSIVFLCGEKGQHTIGNEIAVRFQRSLLCSEIIDTKLTTPLTATSLRGARIKELPTKSNSYDLIAQNNLIKRFIHPYVLHYSLEKGTATIIVSKSIQKLFETLSSSIFSITKYCLALRDEIIPFPRDKLKMLAFKNMQRKQD